MTDDGKSSGSQPWDELSFMLVLQTLTLRCIGQDTQFSPGSTIQITIIVPSLNFFDKIIMEAITSTKRKWCFQPTFIECLLQK